MDKEIKELELKALCDLYSSNCKVDLTYDDETKKGVDIHCCEVGFNRPAKKAYLVSGNKTFFQKNIKFHLLPLSAINEEINHNGKKFIPSDYLRMKSKTSKGASHFVIDKLIEHNFIEGLPVWVVDYLIELQFDLWGLMELGMAVDKRHSVLS